MDNPEYFEGSREFSFRLLERVYNDDFDDDDYNVDDKIGYVEDVDMPSGLYYIDKNLFCNLINLGLIFVNQTEDVNNTTGNVGLENMKQVSSSARTKFSIKKREGVPKTAFYIGEDVLISKTKLLNDTYAFIKEEIFTKKIHDRPVLSTSSEVTLRTLAEKTGINLEGEEKIKGVDVYTLTYGSALLKIYAVGNEVGTKKDTKIPLSQKLKSLKTPKTQTVSQKDFGFKKNELVESYLINTKRDIKTDAAYTKSLQFILGKQKVFDVRLPMKDFLKYSNNSDNQVYFFPQSADDEHENTSTRTFWDPTTKKQISLYDVDGYWLLCFGKTRLLYIIKVNIAPSSQNFSGMFNLENDVITKPPEFSKLVPPPPPSDLPPELPKNTKSVEKFFGVKQPKSSNGINKKCNSYNDEGSEPETFDIDRMTKITTYIDNILGDKIEPFQNIVDLFTVKLMGSFNLSFFSPNYSLKSMIDIKKLDGISPEKFMKLLGVSEVPSIIAIPEIYKGFDEELNMRIYHEYLENIQNINVEACRENDAISLNTSLTCKLIELSFLMFMKNFSVQNRVLHNLEFVNNSKNTLSSMSNTDNREYISTDDIIFNMDGPQIYSRETGIYKISKKMNMTDVVIQRENFSKYYVYELSNVLVSLFVSCSNHMLVYSNNLLGTFDKDHVMERKFFNETVIKELFSICEYIYTTKQTETLKETKKQKDLDTTINETKTEIENIKFEMRKHVKFSEDNIVSANIRATKCDQLISAVSLTSYFAIGLMNPTKKFEGEIISLSDDINNSSNIQNPKLTEKIVKDNLMTHISENLAWSFIKSFVDEWEFGNHVKQLAMDSVETFSSYYMSKKMSKGRVGNSQIRIPQPICVEINSLYGLNDEKNYTGDQDEKKVDMKDKINETIMKIRYLSSIRCMVLISLKNVLLYANAITDQYVHSENIIETTNITNEILNNLDCYNRSLLEENENESVFKSYASYMENQGAKTNSTKFIDHVKIDLANLFL